MHIADVATARLRDELASQRGIAIDCGAARVRMRSDLPALADLLRIVYRGYQLADADCACDVAVTLRRARGLRRWIRPQVELVLDAARELEPFPADTPLPLLEWGLNFALATRLTCYLLLHSGVVERHGRAVLLPAMPGAGKSTLAAALSLRGFRLLSDEFGVVRPGDARLLPLLRPVALKNESIDVIARLAPDAVIGPRFPKTYKGTVAHLAPAPEHVRERHKPAEPALVVFPRFDPGCGVEIEPLSRARAFARLAVNAFNYEVLGPDGFDALGRIVSASACYQLRYGDLARAVQAIGHLLDEAAVGH
ncbi:MAG: HprK-related kinase A [Burkholderiaceae bacterium]|nr:HprK-related kinase A [Burkholderiaceae bacterium]